MSLYLETRTELSKLFLCAKSQTILYNLFIMRFLSIDHGEKKIGLAISDEKNLIASPLPFLKVISLADSISKINRIIKNQNLKAIVVGLPLSQDRGETQQSIKIRYFADSLKRSNEIEIIFWNESFTTREAETAPLTRKKSRNLDSESARIILQEFLDNFNESKESGNNSLNSVYLNPKV